MNSGIPLEEPDARAALDCLADAVIVTDGNGRVRYANPAAERLLGEHASELSGRMVPDLLQLLDDRTGEPLPDPVAEALSGPPWTNPDSAEHEPVLVAPAREEPAPVRISVNVMAGDGDTPAGAVLVLHDDTDARALRRALIESAAQDPLTRLVNRAEFTQRAQRLLGDNNGPHALLYLDIDRFKEINESRGHAAGDYALREITRLFAEMIRARDTFARLGGDEFGLLLEHCGPSVAEQIASSFHATLVSRPLSWRQEPFPLSISIGGTLIRGDEPRDVEAVIEAAREACEQAKADDARPVRIAT